MSLSPLESVRHIVDMVDLTKAGLTGVGEMALLAETLVEEWMNRQGFFTIRGIRSGASEMDLLGVRFTSDRQLEGWHVEVQVSFRPASYISDLTAEQSALYGRKPRSAWTRPPDAVRVAAQAWVAKKFTDRSRAREEKWPGLSWRLKFVHGIVKHDDELRVIGERGVELVPFHEVLTDLCDPPASVLPGAAGGDLAEIVRYYASWRSSSSSRRTS